MHHVGYLKISAIWCSVTISKIYEKTATTTNKDAKTRRCHISHESVLFNSVLRSAGSRWGHEGRLSTDRLPVFSVGGHRDQFWPVRSLTLSILHLHCRRRRTDVALPKLLVGQKSVTPWERGVGVVREVGGNKGQHAYHSLFLFFSSFFLLSSFLLLSLSICLSVSVCLSVCLSVSLSLSLSLSLLFKKKKY